MTRIHRLLMIDDDEALGQLLAEYLTRFGHQLQVATTAARGLDALRASAPELVILDIMLPDKDGLTVCREIRDQWDIPIIMLTARGEVSDRILGLELGADDYMAKPFEPRELAARIDTVLRRTQKAQSVKSLQSNGLTLEPETRRVTLDGELLDLTSMEFELLMAFLSARGRVLSRDQLLERLRGMDAQVFDRAIDMHVSRLRQKLGEDARSPRFIKTVWRTGYQFIG